LSSVSPSAQAPIVRLGRYRLLLELGQGGMARVFVAVSSGLAGFNKLVVLKVLKRCLSQDDEFRAMFLGEATLAARLRHPHIVQTNEVLEHDGVPAMVMEYLDGQPLSQVIVRGKGGAFPPAMQLRILVDALHGLHAAHELTDFDGTPLGVVHRDVSPWRCSPACAYPQVLGGLKLHDATRLDAPMGRRVCVSRIQSAAPRGQEGRAGPSTPRMCHA